MSKKAKAKNKVASTDFIRERVTSFFKDYPTEGFNFKQLSRKLGLKSEEERIELETILLILVRSGALLKIRDSYKHNSKASFTVGRVDFVNQRFGYVVAEEDGKDDIWVSVSNLHYALDGDLVKVSVHPGNPKKDKRPEGEVIEILERKRTEYVGKIEMAPRFAFVIADNRKMHSDIFVPLEKLNKAKNGEKVIVRITEWPDKNNKNPVGEVIQVLGMAGDNDTEMNSIMAEFGLPVAFPNEVLNEAKKISVEISESEIKKRRDFRNILTFTIDPVDAKDFDDALSILKLENGNWEIGVHIADVTHYVEEGSPLEKEAYNRATSVYLVDRTIPMLPEKLSNELCSLRPNEDKLTFSAVFEMKEDAGIVNEWFGKTIIHSDKRFAYEDVQEILENKEGEYLEEILVLNDLAHKLRKDRFKKGAIGFETIEVKFKLDEKGKPLAVIPKIRKDAHKLIEDFMLLANRKVAEYVRFMKKDKEKNTFVYRIHDHPSIEKLNSLAVFAKKFGHNLKLEDERDLSNQLNQLVEEVEGKPEQNVLQSLAIRTMAKAVYSTEPEIHFGLAFKHYSHFTSPIRRYPDMMAHRLLFHYLKGGKSVSKEAYDEKCKHSSEMEKLAAEAERASIKYKQVEFMASLVDQEMDGIISGVIEFGMFVEIIDTKCEGMVRLSELEDDFYEFDPDNYRIVGKRNKRTFTLGDPVCVRVKKTDLAKRTIDLELVERGKSERKAEPKSEAKAEPNTKGTTKDDIRKKQMDDYGFEF